ncbi:MAG: cellulase family glycosylhydrolase [Chthoniobacterales bacterium]
MKTSTKIYLLLLIAALGGLLYFFFAKSISGGETEAGRLAELPAAKAEITTEEAEAEEIPLPGLTVKQGRLLLDGRPYRGMGINYVQCFWELLKDPANRDFVEGFRIIREDYDIPFIRFAASPFHSYDWRLYAEDPEEYFRRMDLIVREAEKRGLGLIPSLFWWNAAVGDWCEEPLGEMGNPQSKTRAFYRTYATEFVNRYKDSPAIWGWEIGNEYLLGADLPKLNHLPRPKAGSKEPRTAADKLTRPMILDLYRDLYQTIRALDAGRIIVTGDSLPREAAWFNRHKDDWGLDSREQWLEMLAADTPAEFSVVSIHLYPELDRKYFRDEKVSLEELLRAAVQSAHGSGRAVWCGEFGPGEGHLADRPRMQSIFNALMEIGVDLSALWNFCPRGKTFQPDIDVTPTNEGSWLLPEIAAFNRAVAAEEPSRRP